MSSLSSRRLALALGGAASALLLALPANAQNILYRNDSVLGTDYFGNVLASGGYDLTSTDNDLGSFTLGDYDLVVYANQNSNAFAEDIAALDAYVAAGGRVIFTDWQSSSPDFLGGTFTGNNNQTEITVSGPFATGISGTLTATNPGWGIYTTGLSATTGTVAATFANGDAAIIYGNDGRTIWNGFLTDTVDSEQLYKNQLAFVFGASSPVPEPATWAMMISGFGLVGGAMRRQRMTTRVTFA
ncbi:hypothetical protein ACFB49_13910 [Sphingomonas sp. DBB INV C78]|uniref:PEPxxWA-CTERM sorting domain-containing protein n=1 Tax=Sphingomonas sp. DBB INV C78 TaxID=3349434 RepID=UPI0036D3AFD1